MPRKPKLTKHTITVVVNGAPITVILHPPTGRRSSWFAYWTGLVASKSTGQAKLEDAILVAENMVKNGGKQATVASVAPLEAVLTDEEFEEIQRVHFARMLDPKTKARAEKSLKGCLEAIEAFKTITALPAAAAATADDCAAFQRKAMTYPKNWRQKHPKSKENVDCLSPNTVKKWLCTLQAAFERANRNAGRKCVRGVVSEARLLTENPWKKFTWIEGREKPIRQFDNEELVSVLAYFEERWPCVTAVPLLAKLCLWSWSRRDEVVKLEWSMLRGIEGEHHFEIEGKRGVRKWFRIPDGLFKDLVQIRTTSRFVFAAYSEQIKQHFETSKKSGRAAKVESEFKPDNLGNWFYKKLVRWSTTLPNGKATPHVFRKTSLQYARTGEDINRQVAFDAKLGEGVMMTHCVRESDVQMRHASNRTFQRILASLQPSIAAKYGYVAMDGTERTGDWLRNCSRNWRHETN